jgi:hypothetical protein
MKSAKITPTKKHTGGIMPIEYPLDMRFEFHTLNPDARIKVSILVPQISVRDAGGELLFYVKQKLFELKEKVTVFADQEQTQVLYRILADRVIDFSANYRIYDPAETLIGTVRRKGLRSMWKATYEICEQGKNDPSFTLKEKSFLVRAIDSLISEFPFIGGLIFNPIYLVRDVNGVTVMKLKKRPYWLEEKFRIEKMKAVSHTDEELLLLSLIMITLLERTRG